MRMKKNGEEVTEFPEVIDCTEDEELQEALHHCKNKKAAGADT